MKRDTIFATVLCAAFLSTAMLSAQGVRSPAITSIPGGLFAEWSSPVEIMAIQLDGRLSGPFEMMFDVPSVSALNDIIARRGTPTANPDTLMILADYWILRGRPERAITLYRKGLEQEDLDRDIERVFQNNLAMLYSRVLRQHDRALEIIRTALETRRDDFTLLNTEGLILLESGSPTAATNPLERAVRLSCERPIYCMHLAYALLQDNRPTHAQRWFDVARPYLIGDVSGMSPENRGMFDRLQLAFPSTGGE